MKHGTIEEWLISADRSRLNGNYKHHLMMIRLFNRTYSLEIPDFYLHDVSRVFNENFKMLTIDI